MRSLIIQQQTKMDSKNQHDQNYFLSLPPERLSSFVKRLKMETLEEVQSAFLDEDFCREAAAYLREKGWRRPNEFFAVFLDDKVLERVYWPKEHWSQTAQKKYSDGWADPMPSSFVLFCRGFIRHFEDNQANQFVDRARKKLRRIKMRDVVDGLYSF